MFVKIKLDAHNSILINTNNILTIESITGSTTYKLTLVNGVQYYITKNEFNEIIGYKDIELIND